MLHQSVLPEVLPIHSVVPVLKSKAMVPDRRSYMNPLYKLLVALRAIEAIFERPSHTFKLSSGYDHVVSWASPNSSPRRGFLRFSSP